MSDRILTLEISSDSDSDVEPVPKCSNGKANVKMVAASSNGKYFKNRTNTANTKNECIQLDDDTDNECVVVAERPLGYAPENGLLLPWQKCEILWKKDGQCCVRFCDKNAATQTFRCTEVASGSESKGFLLSPSRVIAVLKRLNNVRYFYAGVIGETPRPSNKMQYLVFFDNGRVKYVQPQHIRATFENDLNESVHENIREFIKYRFKTGYTAEKRKEFQLPIVKGPRGSRLKIECEGKWLDGKIIQTLHESMIKVEYSDTKRFEWIYRGSPRLGPVWRKNLKDRNVNPELSLIEAYSSAEDESDDDVQIVQSASSATPKKMPKYSKVRTTQLNVQNEELYRAPREYRTHVCSPACCAFRAPLEESKLHKLKIKLRKYSPLALPMIMGWSRKSSKRLVSYETPCGKVMRNLYNLRKYLLETECQLLGMDNFSYECRVDCLRTLITEERHILNQDITNGAEWKPITVHNVFNQQMPEKFTYVAKMILHRNVPNFLSREKAENMSCCDCTDDCSNHDDCSCWQLTLHGLNFTTANADTFGYQNKRLSTLVTTGIYECNVNCKCSDRCTNRVVQIPIAHNLQIFKTKKCGWGVRCLHDIPAGAFVCCYFGDLMTEEHTEQLAIGKNRGDMYLAQLDFIELAEDFKDGYEANAPSMSDDNDNDIEPPPKKYRSSPSSSSEMSSTDSFAPNELDMAVINYFPRTEIKHAYHTRELFDRKCLEYIIDGKKNGNVGRFFNHSCEPNMFLQNVFVDTHDLRFPRLSLFSTCHIPAGTELTWDYNYTVGSINGRKINCECGAKRCRGRLL